MAQKQARKGATRQRMLAAASRGFRAQGFAATGVDGIAQAAGVTSGAFYAHFGSKERAFQAAVDAGLDEVVEGVARYQRDFGEKWVEAFADYYLGAAHRVDLACGCAMTTLSPEVVRAGREIRAGYETKMAQIASAVAEGLAGGSAEDRHARAWAMLAALIGGLTLVRAVARTELAEEIAAAVRDTVLTAAGKVKAPPRGKTQGTG